MRMIDAYLTASSSMVGVAPRNRTKLCVNARPTTPKSRPSPIEVAKAVEKTWSASTRFFSPKRRATVLAEPWPRVIPMAWMRLMIE
ncbi:hypothetical protein SDC9_187198 [bioreactor metagenome]|uniref:Uncharacterized protein n=1 Tax=bioreactor metagenome TaxID=1076179 RepID=A0A645HLL0_9ZZZZ